MKILLIALITGALFTSFAIAQGKNSTLEKAIIDEVLGEDVKGSKGGGRPSNPGAHGRANAEYKKATNPGKGVGKSSSLEGALVGEIFDDDDKDDKDDRGKNKGKAKDK